VTVQTLTNQSAIATGGGPGIGRDIALALARCDVKVVVSGRHLEPIMNTLDQIKLERGQGIAKASE
jgi:NAD(P)-dependent dehydrogenase (short-subunit alcohol dehydrogenase family)